MAWRFKRDRCDQLPVYGAIELRLVSWCGPASVSGEAAALRSGRSADSEH